MNYICQCSAPKMLTTYGPGRTFCNDCGGAWRLSDTPSIVATGTVFAQPAEAFETHPAGTGAELEALRAELARLRAENYALSAVRCLAHIEDIATPSGGLEAGPQEERIEAAYWRFDARHKDYGEWKQAPMSERDAFKTEMRNALEAEKVRAGMRQAASTAAELERLRTDAERYRWLRDHPDADVRIVGVGKRSGESLDAAVDQARKA